MSRQRGSATVLATMVTAVVMVLAVCIGGWAAAVGVRHAASGASDMAALAGAQSQVRGLPACTGAFRWASLNNTRLVQCRVVGEDVHVVVEASRQLRVLGRSVTLTARRDAWAGPITPTAG